MYKLFNSQILSSVSKSELQEDPYPYFFADKVFEKANNLHINLTIGVRRDGDIEQIYANSNLVKEKLGWVAKETLEQAMKSAWDWAKQKN